MEWVGVLVRTDSATYRLKPSGARGSHAFDPLNTAAAPLKKEGAAVPAGLGRSRPPSQPLSDFSMTEMTPAACELR